MNTDLLDEMRGTTVATSSDTAVERFRQNWKILIAVAVFIGVAVAGYWWYSTNEELDNQSANAALARIRPTFDAGDFEKALTGAGLPAIDGEPIAGLQSIYEQYGSTDAGKVAALMAGTCHLNGGKATEAKAAFEVAQGSASQAVAVGALNGLGACAELEDNLPGAAQYYERAAEVGDKSGLEARSLLYAGLVYEKTGNKEKAGEIFTMVAKKYAMTDMSGPARAGLSRLGMRID